MEWHYAKEGKQFGPVEEAELIRLARAGELKPTDLVWNATMGQQWVAASSVPNLFTPPTPAMTSEVPLETDASLVKPGRMPNRMLMRMARTSLHDHWGIAIGIIVLLVVLHLAVRFICGIAIWCLLLPISVHVPFRFISLLSVVGTLIIGGPLAAGCALFFLNLVRRKETRIGQLFAGFNCYGLTLGAYLLMALFILLWMLLLIIPGLIASLAYSMTFYVIMDNPGIGPLEALRKSKDMMYGHKWKLFCLGWRFLGWMLLSILTCGIGYLWLVPYVYASTTHFYEDVRPRQA